MFTGLGLNYDENVSTEYHKTSLPQAVIILAGGTGKRLGGVSKPDYRVAGRRLLDLALEEITAAGFTGRRVVVAPAALNVPAGVQVTLEDPPLGGPLAGIAAGVASLSDLPASAIVAVMPCDAPLTPRLWPALCAKLDSGQNEEPSAGGEPKTGASTLLRPAETQGAVPTTADAEAWPQYLHGCYRLGALRGLPATRDTSVKRGFSGLHFTRVADTSELCADVDTPADAARMVARLNQIGV